MKKIIPIVSAFLLILFGACTKNPLDPGGTSAHSMANEWWITFSLNGVDQIGTHVKIATYNTSENKDSIWVDDLQDTWQFKCKARADYQNHTFTTKDAQNETYDIQVNINNGKIIPKAGRSKTGNVADSIYFEVNFTDDPTNTYVISGTARTMYAEDDY